MSETTEKKRQALANGELLNKEYQIVELLSSAGGTGYIYRAIKVKTGEMVAIKEFFPKGYCYRDDAKRMVPSFDASEEEEYNNTKKRFEAEIQLIKSVQDTGVVLKFYTDFQENNTIYYAMELLKGRNLREHLGENAINIDDTLKILEPIFNALIVLHNIGIIHRDISPDNIFICDDGSVKLIDFGNAHVGTDDNHEIDMEKYGYSPIEQRDSKYEQGPWTDVHALGATCYRCLTGRDPMRIEKRLLEKMKSPKDLGCDITEYEDEAIMRALELYPANRYRSVDDFKRDFFVSFSGGTAGFDAGNVKLLGLTGVFKDKEISVKGTMIFGRKKGSCNVLYPESTQGISGRHCCVIWDDEKEVCLVRDLGSSYGTKTLKRETIPLDKEVPLTVGEGFILANENAFLIIRDN